MINSSTLDIDSTSLKFKFNQINGMFINHIDMIIYIYTTQFFGILWRRTRQIKDPFTSREQLENRRIKITTPSRIAWRGQCWISSLCLHGLHRISSLYLQRNSDVDNKYTYKLWHEFIQRIANWRKEIEEQNRAKC